MWKKTYYHCKLCKTHINYVEKRCDAILKSGINKGKQCTHMVYNGTDYCRVGSQCLGEDYPTSVAAPGFFGPDNSTFYTFGPSSNISYFKGYEDRVKGAPYFFQFDSDDILAGDNIPLDTANSI